MRRNGEGRRNERDRDRGQATVEFALILPLLVLCLVGIIWVGQLMTTQVQVEHAAREGARAAAVAPERASSVALAAVQTSMPEAQAVTRIGSVYVTVEVRVEAPGVPLLGIGSRVLVADAVMRREDIID